MKDVIERSAQRLAMVLALVFFIQGIIEQRELSLTWDEPSFISAGYMYLTRGDFQLNPSHPPLMQDLAALPLLFLNLRELGGDEREWRETTNPVVALGRKFIYESGNDAGEIAFWARLPVLLLGTILVYALFLWGKKLYGAYPALLATFLAAFNPELLAHAELATEDLGWAAFMFFAVWSFWRASASGNLLHWSICGFITGLALIAKYTSLLLAPIYLLLGGYVWFIRGIAVKPMAILKTAAVGTGLALAVIGAGYNFSFDFVLYLNGLSKIYGDVRPAYVHYLYGKVSEQPFWYYSLAAFFVKVPVLTIMLMGLAAVRAWDDREHREAMVFLLVPALVVIVASFFDAHNFGLRRILSAFPFLILFTAQTVPNSGDRARQAIMAALFGCAALEAAQAGPHRLSYFNFAAGGPKNGPLYLDDSNIDWGQDLPALAKWQQANPDAIPLKLLYFGSAKPSAYNVQAVDFTPREILNPQPGYYAVSAHNLVWFRKLKKQFGYDVDWLTKYKPIAMAGYSIYIYHFP